MSNPLSTNFATYLSFHIFCTDPAFQPSFRHHTADTGKPMTIARETGGKLYFLLTALCILVLARIASADSSTPPNIIYIMADDLGYGDLGSYGQTVVQTPNLDQMAQKGLRFTNHYSGQAVCRPSRLVLWTGQHTGHTGFITNDEYNLTGNDATVASLLQDAGYVTGGVGKWALATEESGHPNNNGFDYWMGYLDQGNAHNYYPPFLWENDKKIKLAGNVLDDSEESRGRVSQKQTTYSHTEITEPAFAFIRRNSNNPFLLHVHWTLPHANTEAGKMFGDGMEVPDYGIYQDEDWPNPEKGFAAMVTLMDRDVGRLIDLLKELMLDKNTLVLFTSDNGPHSAGGHKSSYFNSSGPLRGAKRSLFEGGIRVPLIAYWPGKVKAGTVTNHVSAFWDYYPTVAEIAGIEPTGKIDGISYLPTLLGSTAQQEEHEYLYWGNKGGPTELAVRHGKWKLVKYKERGFLNFRRKTQTHLYNLETDLGEEYNVASQNPEAIEQIKALLKRDGLKM